MDQPIDVSGGCLRLFHHHLYEYSKGVRQMFMMTLHEQEAEPFVRQLADSAIDHYVHHAGERRVNLFFGRAAYIETTRSLVTKPLCRLSPEEDFILGVLLGYDREQQCRRFLSRTRH